MHLCGTKDNKVQVCLQAVDVQEVCVWDGSVRQGNPFLSALLVANTLIETLEQIFQSQGKIEKLSTIRCPDFLGNLVPPHHYCRGLRIVCCSFRKRLKQLEISPN